MAIITDPVNCFERLPDELLMAVTARLSPDELSRFSSVCTRFHQIANDVQNWKSLAQREGVVIDPTLSLAEEFKLYLRIKNSGNEEATSLARCMGPTRSIDFRSFKE